MEAFLVGFSSGLTLILAIGAQNAFVLRQGIMGRHIVAVCLTCALSDALLISLGVFGFAIAGRVLPSIEKIALIGGVIFLVVYGFKRLMSALTSQTTLRPADAENHSLLKTIITCLAFTFLNPHVYLDTVILLGSISAQFSGASWIFGLGAILASFVFFFSLGFGARLVRPLFSKPLTWRLLDAFIGLTMWYIALLLVSDYLLMH